MKRWLQQAQYVYKTGNSLEDSRIIGDSTSLKAYNMR